MRSHHGFFLIERAAVNAFANAYIKISIRGCYFHICQAFLQKINDLGLKKVRK